MPRRCCRVGHALNPDSDDGPGASLWAPVDGGHPLKRYPCDKIAAGDRDPTSANRTQFDGRRNFLGNPARKVGTQRFPHEFGPGAVLLPPHALQLLEHGGRQGNGKGGRDLARNWPIFVAEASIA